MAVPTLVATAGASNANSYATVAEADAYHEAHLYASAWVTLTEETKIRALIMATRLLDSYFDWIDYPTADTQALQWPRAAMIARGGRVYIANDVIPTEIKNATAELARQLIIADRTVDSDIETQGITSLRAGPVSVTFREFQQPKVIPDAVRALIPAWWGTLSGVKSGIREVQRA